jgi:hypothetical protein
VLHGRLYDFSSDVCGSFTLSRTLSCVGALLCLTLFRVWELYSVSQCVRETGARLCFHGCMSSLQLHSLHDTLPLYRYHEAVVRKDVECTDM